MWPAEQSLYQLQQVYRSSFLARVRGRLAEYVPTFWSLFSTVKEKLLVSEADQFEPDGRLKEVSAATPADFPDYDWVQYTDVINIAGQEHRLLECAPGVNNMLSPELKVPLVYVLGHGTYEINVNVGLNIDDKKLTFDVDSAKTKMVMLGENQWVVDVSPLGTAVHVTRSEYELFRSAFEEPQSFMQNLLEGADLFYSSNPAYMFHSRVRAGPGSVMLDKNINLQAAAGDIPAGILTRHPTRRSRASGVPLFDEKDAFAPFFTQENAGLPAKLAENMAPFMDLYNREVHLSDILSKGLPGVYILMTCADVKVHPHYPHKDFTNPRGRPMRCIRPFANDDTSNLRGSRLIDAVVENVVKKRLLETVSEQSMAFSEYYMKWKHPHFNEEKPKIGGLDFKLASAQTSKYDIDFVTGNLAHKTVEKR